METLLRIPTAPSESHPAETEREQKKAPRRWCLQALTGGVAEISGPVSVAGITAAARLICEAQEQGEPAAWIAAGDSSFYPPDLHEAGADLEALPVVRVAGLLAGARAAEHLLRSGAFGLLVLDLGSASRSPVSGSRPREFNSSGSHFSGSRPAGSPAVLPPAALARLAALCRRHRTAFLLLARRPEGTPPVVSLASLRATGSTRRTAFDQFSFRLEVLKDKSQGVGWSCEEVFRGPEGLA